MSARKTPSSRSRRGFTLIEVLATMALMGIALPVLLNGISVATGCAEVARHRNEAAALAESQLNEIVAEGGTYVTPGSPQSGDFPDWPDYHWQSVVVEWTQSGLNQLDLHVTWKDRSGDREIVVSTLVYDNSNANTNAAGTTSGTSATSGAGKSAGKSTGSTGSGGTGGTGAKGTAGGGK